MSRSLILISLLSGVLWPAATQAQFTFTTNSGAITIKYYTGSGGAVVIPASTNGYLVTSIGDYAFSSSSVTIVTIPNSVTNIGLAAFAYCYILTSVPIPNNVISIGNNAFQQCSSLTSVTIPNSVTSIGDDAFVICTHLTNITVIGSNLAYSSLSGVLFDKTRSTLIQFPTGLGGSYLIPNSVTNIGHNAFPYCVSLTNVTIPNSVITIGGAAFDHCTSLTSVTIGNGVTSIGDSAFGECASLTSVTIPASVTNIGPGAFYYCTSLKSVTIGNGVIGVNAFAFCPSLTSAYFQGNAPPDNGNAFFGDPATVYYLYGTTGWGMKFGGVPAVLWNPHAQRNDSFGVQNNQFGFNISGSSNLVIVVEAATNLASPVWSPVSTNTLNTFTGTNGTSYFSDSQWTNYPSRFYRLRSP